MHNSQRIKIMWTLYILERYLKSKSTHVSTNMKPIVRLLINKEFYNLKDKTFGCNWNRKCSLNLYFVKNSINEIIIKVHVMYKHYICKFPYSYSRNHSYIFRNQLYKFCIENNLIINKSISDSAYSLIGFFKKDSIKLWK